MGRIIAAILLWSLWVICILLVLPVLINVPGQATVTELSLYLAVLIAVTGYPILLPVLTVAGHRARQPATGTILNLSIWISFGAVLAVFATVSVHVFVRERAKPVPTRTEIVQSSYANAILSQDTHWMDRLMAEGASVDEVLPPFGQTPAIMSADFGDWTLVWFLLRHGADPDRRDRKGNSVRTLATSPRMVPEKSAENEALKQVRADLARKEPHGPSN